MPQAQVGDVITVARSVGDAAYMRGAQVYSKGVWNREIYASFSFWKHVSYSELEVIGKVQDVCIGDKLLVSALGNPGKLFGYRVTRAYLCLNITRNMSQCIVFAGDFRVLQP